MNKQAFVLKWQVGKQVASISVNVIHKHRNYLLLLLINRAFEERQKEEEAKEQRFREQVLQQRKIKFQEATAKFQHAHQSFSQQKQTGLSINCYSQYKCFYIHRISD